MSMRGAFCNRLSEARDVDYRLSRANPEALRMVARYLRPHLGVLLGALGCMAVVSGSTLAGPYLAKVAVDACVRQRDVARLGWVVGAFVLVCAVQWVASYWGTYLARSAGEAMVADLRRDLYAHIMSLSLDFFETRRTGQIISSFTGDASALAALVSTGMATMLNDAMTVTGAVIILVVINPTIACAALVVVPLILVGVSLVSRSAVWLAREARRTVGDLGAEAEERLTGIRVIQALAREDDNAARFQALTSANLAANMKAAVASALLFPMVSVSGTIGTALVLWVGGVMVGRGGVTLGVLVAALGYVNRSFMPLRELSQMYGVYQTGAAAAERIYGYFRIRPTVLPPERPVQLPQPVRGLVELRGVTFGYEPGLPVIRDIHLAFEPGQVTGVVGPTGAGKTTLVRLLARLHDPAEGRVTIDGVDIRELPGAELRKAVAVVPQDTVIFPATIRDNIRYGKPGAADEEVERAAKLACVDQVAARLPGGYDTVVGEGGVSLSAGERQLVALARAILADPPVLVLDEPAANVDPVTEGLIRQAIGRLLAGRTTVITTHRFAMLAQATRIVVLDSGRVVASGTHGELLRTCPLYRELYEKQRAELSRCDGEQRCRKHVDRMAGGGHVRHVGHEMRRSEGHR